MFSTIWHTLFFDPVYNTLVFFIDIIPGGDVGLAIIFTTILVKVVLLPLSIKAAKTQKVLKEIEPKLRKLKEDITDKQEQARAMMDIYKDAGINPFASIFLMFLQIPIIIALYLSVSTGGGVKLPEINTEFLYSFVPPPAGEITMQFLGLIDITQASILLALLAAAGQFVHIRYMMPKPEPRDPNKEPNFKDDFARTMQFQMRYVMPVMIFFVAYFTSAAIALYFFVSSLAAIAQEVFVAKHR